MSGRRLLALAQRLRALNVGGAAAGPAAALARASSSAAAAGPATPKSRAAAAAFAPLLPHRRLAWTDSKGYTHFGERTPLAVVGFGGGGPGGGGGRGGAGSPHSRIMAGAAALGAGSLGLYWWRCRETVPFTGRRHSVMFVSPEMEASMGRQTFAEIRREAASRNALLPDSHPAARLVARVGGRVAAAAETAGEGPGAGDAGHMRGLAWEYAVVDDPQVVNAMVAPGGKVVVYTGLLRLVGGNADELAAVLAHEASHVLCRHHAERLGRANFAALANVLARWLLGVPVPGAVVALALVLPHSRANEREADAVGVRLAARACFDPAANVRMLKRLAAVEARGQSGGGAGGLALLRTHPLTAERVAAVEALLPAALAEYEARCGGLRAALGDRAWGYAAAAPGPLG